MASGTAVGRKLDFLAQEFNREANTLCSKSTGYRVDAHWACAQGHDRPVPRAGAERRMSTNIPRRGLMLVLSSPSGAGKTTLSRGLLDSGCQYCALGIRDHAHEAAERERRPATITSCAPTSSTPRSRPASFSNMRTVFDHITARREARDGCACAGPDVLFDIDWQGTQQLKEQRARRFVSIFVLPPSHDELERRLRTRAQDPEDVVARRMAKAAGEISHWPEYDYVIVNDDLDRRRRGEGDPRRRTAAPHAAGGPFGFRAQADVKCLREAGDDTPALPFR